LYLVSATIERQDRRPAVGRTQLNGLKLLVAMQATMWAVLGINALDSWRLDYDGIYSRSMSRLWGILTSPFIHASLTHLLSDAIPFVFLGVIIAWRGAARLASVTGFVIVLGGLLTWLIGPSHVSEVGSSGVVFGYATYLMTRGFFDRRLWEILVGIVVAVVWGATLIASLVPHTGISWQAHVCGGIAGIFCAWWLSAVDHRGRRSAEPAAGPGSV
jgi:membrane associated rhomboid family serine protease